MSYSGPEWHCDGPECPVSKAAVGYNEHAPSWWTVIDGLNNRTHYHNRACLLRRLQEGGL